MRKEEDKMRKRSLFVAFSVVGVLIFLLGTVNPSPAGQTIKFHSKHINVATKFDTVEVGDKPGHVVALFQAKGVGVRTEGPGEPPYKIEIWGTGDYQGDGTGKELGYGKFIFSDGSYYYEKWTGNVSGNRDTGTAVYYGGTGRFKGMTGGSKFDCILFGDRFICEVDGTIELP